MPVTLEDILLRMSDDKEEVLKEIRGTKDSLGKHIAKVELGLVEAAGEVKAHGREIGEVKRDLRDHKRSHENTASTQVASEPAVETKSLKKQISFYASLGAFLTGATLTLLNLFGLLG